MLQLCNLRQGGYYYTRDKLALERRAGPCTQPLPSILTINTPPKLDAWRNLLASYPDQAFVAFLHRGIQEVFRALVSPQTFNAPPHPATSGRHLSTQRWCKHLSTRSISSGDRHACHQRIWQQWPPSACRSAYVPSATAQTSGD